MKYNLKLFLANIYHELSLIAFVSMILVGFAFNKPQIWAIYGVCLILWFQQFITQNKED